jgi:hypothetical protein
VFVTLLLLLLCLPFYFIYHLCLRTLVQLLWVARGKRVLLVYSRSPVWQTYIETSWLPRIREQSVILNWSDRATWRRTKPLAARVFNHWAPATDFNPMAIVFLRFPRTQRIGFYYAFRDWKHGNETALRAAEAELFGAVSQQRGLSA